MNKKEFLKILSKKLEVLDEQEVKDILNEYEDIIVQKVKDGKKEIDAVKEFGSVDELASEILKTYKLNSKYIEKDEPFKEHFENFEGFIKKTASSMAEFFKGLGNGNGLTIELVFELIIKFMILIVLLAFLRLPFELLIEIGNGIFEIVPYPLDEVMCAFWRIGMSIVYFIAGALIFIAFFKQYINNNVVEEVPKEKVKKTTGKVKKETAFETIQVKEKKVSNSNNGFGMIVSSIYKAFMTIIFLIPLWCINFGMFVALGICIYFTVIGINIWGLAILLLGLCLCLVWLISFFHIITFNAKKQLSFIIVYVGIVISAFGTIALCSNILSFDYIDDVKKVSGEYKIYSESFTIEEEKVSFYSEDDRVIEYVVDEEIQDGVVSVEVEYAKDAVSINDIQFETYTYGKAAECEIMVKGVSTNEYKTFKKLWNTIIEDLKDGKIYNYSENSFYNIIIKGNEETMKLIK